MRINIIFRNAILMDRCVFSPSLCLLKHFETLNVFEEYDEEDRPIVKRSKHIAVAKRAKR
jgi:hypothetical protein